MRLPLLVTATVLAALSGRAEAREPRLSPAEERQVDETIRSAKAVIAQVAEERVFRWARARLLEPDRVITQSITSRMDSEGVVHVRIVWNPVGKYGSHLGFQEACFRYLRNGVIQDVALEAISEDYRVYGFATHRRC